MELLADVREADAAVLVEHRPSPGKLEAFMKAELANEAQLKKLRELSRDELPSLRQLSSQWVLGG